MIVPSFNTSLQYFVQQLQQVGCQRLVLGFSGGMDSVVLLQLLHQHLPKSVHLQTCYVHHGLSRNADSWQTFCAHYAQQLGVSFTAIKVQVPSGARQGIEANARKMRYQALYDLVMQQPNSALVTAHHQRDQAETVLLNLVRGTGLAGLAAMPYQKLTQQNGMGLYHFRPLLSVPYVELLAFAQQANLQWVEDESNADLSFRRNRIRHKVLPQLNQAWCSAEQNIAKTASHVAESLQLLDDLAELDLAHLVWSDFYVTLPNLSAERVKNVVRFWAKQHAGLALSESILAWVVARVENPNSKKSPERQLKAGVLRFDRQKLFYFKTFECDYHLPYTDFDAHALQFWHAEKLQADCVRLGTNLLATKGYVAPCNPNELPADKRKQLKKCWKIWQTPVWDRARWPAIYNEQAQLIYVLGLGETHCPISAFPVE